MANNPNYSQLEGQDQGWSWENLPAPRTTTPKTNRVITTPTVRQALADATLRARRYSRENSGNKYERRAGHPNYILSAILTAFDGAASRFAKTTAPLYVRDDQGHAWHFDGEKIRCALADDEPLNGYFCKSLEDGIKTLNELGYITGFDEE